jgi:hypothetical protein
VEALAVLSYDKEEAIAHRASEAIFQLTPEAFLDALRLPDAAPLLFRYCAENLAEKPGIADAMAESKACPAEYVVQVAPHLHDAVNALVDDLDRLSSTPELVTALAPSSHLSPQSRAALEEIQKDQPLDDAELARNVEALASAVPEKQKRLSLFQRVAQMRVVERMQLALKGGREERMLLIRDPNKMVQRAVLQSPRVTEQEIESFAAMTVLSDEVLRRIASNRNFIKNYSILRALTFNPKTPIDISLGFMSRLLVTDLKNLTANKNVPETLRTSAQKLFRQRTVKKSMSE